MALTDSDSHIPADYYTFVPPTSVGGSYVDAVFGETVIRVTDAISAGRLFYSPEYSSTSNVNADETYLRLVDDGGPSVLFNLPNFSFFRRLTSVSSSSPSDYWWDISDPNILYSVPYNNNTLNSYSISADTDSVVHTFSNFGSVIGMGQSDLSYDGDRLVLWGKNPVVGNEQLLVYEFSTDSVVASVDIADITDFVEATIAPSGTRIAVKAGVGILHMESWDINDGPGTITHARDFSPGQGHSDIARGPDGKDYIMVLEQNYINGLKKFNMEDGTETTLLTIGWSPFGLDAWISSNSMHRDGWSYISTITPLSDPDPNVSWKQFAGEILRVAWDGSGHERLCHNRTTSTLSQAYWATPRACISESGRYLIWASNYRENHLTSPKKYADTYGMDFGPGSELGASSLSGSGDLSASAIKTALGSSALDATGSLYVMAYAIPTPGAPTIATTGTMGFTGAVL